MSLNLTDIINIYTYICIDPGFCGRILLYIGINPAEKNLRERQQQENNSVSATVLRVNDSSSLALSWLTMHCYVSIRLNKLRAAIPPWWFARIC